MKARNSSFPVETVFLPLQCLAMATVKRQSGCFLLHVNAISYESGVSLVIYDGFNCLPLRLPSESFKGGVVKRQLLHAPS